MVSVSVLGAFQGSKVTDVQVKCDPSVSVSESVVGKGRLWATYGLI
jgi:hypothetical protein